MIAFMSSVKYYSVAFSNQSLPPCSNPEGCYVGTNLSWAGQTSCNLNMICPKLGREACGDFRLSLNFGPSDVDPAPSQQSVCRKDIVSLGTVWPSSGGVGLSLWYRGEAPLASGSCYLWCTSKGQLEEILKNTLPDMGFDLLAPKVSE